MTIYDTTIDGAVTNWRDQDDESAVTVDVDGNRLVMHGSDAGAWLELAVRCLDCAKVQRIRERELDRLAELDRLDRVRADYSPPFRGADNDNGALEDGD